LGADLSEMVITADALHTQRAHAEYLNSRGAEFVLTVKQNQPGLYAALDALPWADTPIIHRDVDTGHARITTRTIQTLPAPADLPFPHVNQVWLIERYVTDPTGTPRSAVAALGVTSLTDTRATPEQVAGFVREHWGIESLHWLRDTVYREDNSTARTGSGPRVIPALRSLALGAIHLIGRRDITETTRCATRLMDRSFKILNLT
ncbi:MAG: ISAs1 family transposase, partial [Actinomycetota bacterium]|nr:ISAs1 family transposase [Actinomycetota bacterium]